MLFIGVGTGGPVPPNILGGGPCPPNNNNYYPATYLDNTSYM